MINIDIGPNISPIGSHTVQSITGSDVNKATSHKAKAKAKVTLLKAKAKAKDFSTSTRPRPRPRPDTTRPGQGQDHTMSNFGIS